MSAALLPWCASSVRWIGVSFGRASTVFLPLSFSHRFPLVAMSDARAELVKRKRKGARNLRNQVLTSIATSHSSASTISGTFVDGDGLKSQKTVPIPSEPVRYMATPNHSQPSSVWDAADSLPPPADVHVVTAEQESAPAEEKVCHVFI
jgi:hypothetical protein